MEMIDGNGYVFVCAIFKRIYGWPHMKGSNDCILYRIQLKICDNVGGEGIIVVDFVYMNQYDCDLT